MSIEEAVQKWQLYAVTVALLLTSPRFQHRYLGGLGEGQVHQAAGRNEAIRAELERMLEGDQTLRSQADEVEKKYGSKSKELEELWVRQTVKDKKNLRRLEEMIKEIGWPGLSSVGGKASLAAFLILQHADYE